MVPHMNTQERIEAIVARSKKIQERQHRRANVEAAKQAREEIERGKQFVAKQNQSTCTLAKF